MKSLLFTLLAGYVAIAGLVWLSQESLLFHPRPTSASARAPSGWSLEEVALAVPDGTRLAGVLLLPPGQVPQRAPLVIYFGGNAEEVTEGAGSAGASYGDRAVLLVNYRGYGKSEGRPGERELIADALHLFDWAAKHLAIDGTRIAIHGRSLGSGVAVPLAASRPVKCVVLTSPFTSVRDVARDLYFWLPVGLLLRHPFDSARVAASVKVPALVLVGEEDTVIAPRHSERLASLWGGTMERAPFKGFGHNDLQVHPEYTAKVRNFLDRHL